MKIRGQYFLLWGMLFACSQFPMQASAQAPEPAAAQLLALANQARAAVGVPPLKWNGALAEAARKHCLRMAAEGPIAHRYPGELDASERAGLSGAHFDLIEENVAVGPTSAAIHDAWMQSKGHRENMLNPEVDAVGISVVPSHGVLYATADYAREVPALTLEQVESRFADQIRSAGVKVLTDHSVAREACVFDNGLPKSAETAPPSFLMRWEGSNLDRLPQKLVEQLASGRYQRAAVGSCSAHGDQGTFTSYRVAVLLY